MHAPPAHRAAPTAAPTAAPNPAATLPLVPDRTCGGCNVCCVALTIRDPALRKPQGVRCHNAAPDNSCRIYDTRPMTCRTYHCGWRHLKWVRATLRPDLSGVLVRLRMHDVAAGQPPATSVVFTILEERGLVAGGFAESIAAAVGSGTPTFFEVPGRPGWTAGIAQVNDVLTDAVRARDKPALLALLRQCWEMGQEGDRRPVTLD